MAFAMHLLLLVTLNGKPRPVVSVYLCRQELNQKTVSQILKKAILKKKFWKALYCSRQSTPGSDKVLQRPSYSTLLKTWLQFTLFIFYHKVDYNI